jgi:hypothetical protein
MGGLADDKRTEEERAKDVASVVGDGGAAWRRKALLRAKQRADEQGLEVAEALQDTLGVTSEREFRQNEREHSDMLRKQKSSDRNGERWKVGRKGCVILTPVFLISVVLTYFNLFDFHQPFLQKTFERQ